VFLTKIMGFEWHEVHHHAGDLGKGLTDPVVQRMAEMTGFPQRCPHGEPIPDEDGILPEVNDTCLINLTVGHKGKISRVRTDESERLAYFSTLGVVPGATFEIVGRAPFNGPIRLRLGREEVVLGIELVKALWVT
jgi:DtxR family Mn-dependent transcriptional regulator